MRLAFLIAFLVGCSATPTTKLPKPIELPYTHELLDKWVAAHPRSDTIRERREYQIFWFTDRHGFKTCWVKLEEWVPRSDYSTSKMGYVGKYEAKTQGGAFPQDTLDSAVEIALRWWKHETWKCHPEMIKEPPVPILTNIGVANAEELRKWLNVGNRQAVVDATLSKEGCRYKVTVIEYLDNDEQKMSHGTGEDLQTAIKAALLKLK